MSAVSEPSYTLRSRGGFRSYQGYTKATVVESPDVTHNGTLSTMNNNNVNTV